jgi:hypothetical protein
MSIEARRQTRRPIDSDVAVTWQDRQGAARFVHAKAVDLSESGLRIEASEPLEVGTYVFVRVTALGLGATSRVCHCTRRQSGYAIGLELAGAPAGASAATGSTSEDFYELLQISPSAEMETIHRVYKILVGRYHPDNPHTGDAEKFLRLTQAYETLSNPGRRAAYDLQREPAHTGPLPVFEMKEFLGGVDAEANRRLGILCLLYKRRQINPDRTGLSLLEFESLMAIPREHLLFTVWFLREKRFVRALEGGQFEITAEGVEFVESSLPAKSIFQRLLRALQDEVNLGRPEDRPS